MIPSQDYAEENVDMNINVSIKLSAIYLLYLHTGLR
jgi:hypothetical protein